MLLPDETGGRLLLRKVSKKSIKGGSIFLKSIEADNNLFKIGWGGLSDF